MFQSRLEFSATVTDGRLDIGDGSRELLLTGCVGAVLLSDGRRFTTEDESTTATIGKAPYDVLWRTISSDDDARPTLIWRLGWPSGSALSLEIHNTTGEPMAVERFEVLDAPTGFLRASAPDLEVMQTGWQSWSPAASSVSLDQARRAESDPMMGSTIRLSARDAVSLPWVTLLTSPRWPRRSLLLGFLSAHTQAGTIVVTPTPSGHRLTAVSNAEGTVVAPGETLRSEPLRILTGLPAKEALEWYAREVNGAMGWASDSRVPSGWCSWYELGEAVSERDIVENLEALSNAKPRLPLDVVQIDDGYQREIGDWLVPNARFPRGMASLAKDIRGDSLHPGFRPGFRAGLWLAPFLLSSRSEVANAHLDWLVRDAGDAPIVAIRHWGADQFVLDVTHPQAAAWLSTVIGTIVREWGYEYLKLDFLYAGALRGRRISGETGIAAYRRGLEIIRRAAGDAFLLGCGAPFLASVGLVDAMRIGRDVTPFWRDSQETGTGRTMANAVRSTFAHAWMHRRLWINDPDCVLLREENSSLSESEVQTWLTVVALSGGTVMVGDDFRSLEAERTAWLARLLPPHGEAATGLPPFTQGLPNRAHLPIEQPWEDWDIVALFNWGDEERPAAFDPSEWPLLGHPYPAVLYHLFDPWTGEHTGPQVGPVALDPIPSHGVRLLAVHSTKGRPQVVGSTLHLLGGAVDVTEERWKNNELVITLRQDLAGRGNGGRGTLMVFVPKQFRFLETDSSGPVERTGQVLRIDPAVALDNILRLRFQRSEHP